MSYDHDAEATLPTATHAEQARLDNIEELLRELDEWRASLIESLGDAKVLAGQAYLQRAQDTLRRIAELDDELHAADFAPEWVAEFRGLLLAGVRALQTEQPLDAYDKLLLNAEAI